MFITTSKLCRVVFRIADGLVIFVSSIIIKKKKNVLYLRRSLKDEEVQIKIILRSSILQIDGKYYFHSDFLYTRVISKLPKNFDANKLYGSRKLLKFRGPEVNVYRVLCTAMFIRTELASCMKTLGVISTRGRTHRMYAEQTL